MEEVSQHGDFKQQKLPFEYDIFLQPPAQKQQSSFGNFGFFMVAEAVNRKMRLGNLSSTLRAGQCWARGPSNMVSR